MAVTVARLRRGLRREALGVDVGAALNLVGALVKYFSLAFLFPMAIAIGYGEPVWPFLGAGGITAVCGWTVERLTRGKERVGAREGFLIVALTWLFAAFFGSLPYVLSGNEQLHSPVDAYFEAMSGFTTTGASVLTDIPSLPHSLMMWRQFTQWLGGMGIIVLALAVLPRLRVGGRQLFESEAPGPEIEQLATTMRETARRLWLLYITLTAAEVGVLTAFAWSGVDPTMSFYDAVAHAFSTLPTGGFSTRARSIEEFGAASQWAIAFFMAVAGANFALMYRAFVRRAPRVLPRDEEFRLYVALLALGSIVLAAELANEGLHAGEEAARHAVFQAVSIMTTTGYVSTDFNEWLAAAPLAAMVVVALMFAGGSAGSTAGSVKVVRHALIGRILRRELDQTVHPELVQPIRYNRAVDAERAVRAAIAFVLLYVGLFALGALAIVVDSARADVDVSPIATIAAAAATLGNVGPGVGFAGPMGSFAPFSDVSKAVMIALMWLGRLEIIPVAVLFTRNYWRA